MAEKNWGKYGKKLEAPFLSQDEKDSIRADLQYLESKKTDCIGFYSSLNKININRINKRKIKSAK